MATKIRFERNAMMSAAHLTSDDGGSSFVFCSIPGGTPQFALTPQSRTSTTVANAPQCETHKQFEAFVRERFGD